MSKNKRKKTAKNRNKKSIRVKQKARLRRTRANRRHPTGRNNEQSTPRQANRTRARILGVCKTSVLEQWGKLPDNHFVALFDIRDPVAAKCLNSLASVSHQAHSYRGCPDHILGLPLPRATISNLTGSYVETMTTSVDTVVVAAGGTSLFRFGDDGTIYPVFTGPPDIQEHEAENVLVMFEIPRQYTRRGVSGGQSIADQLASYPASLRGKVALSFGGYDDDPRELYQIPEVRRFCEGFLTHRPEKVWPYLVDELVMKAMGLPVPTGVLQTISMAFPEHTSSPTDRVGIARRVDLARCIRIARRLNPACEFPFISPDGGQA